MPGTIAVAYHQRSYSSREEGTEACHYSLSNSSEIATLKHAEQRNYTAWNTGYGSCDSLRLTPAQIRSTAAKSPHAQ